MALYNTNDKAYQNRLNRINSNWALNDRQQNRLDRVYGNRGLAGVNSMMDRWKQNKRLTAAGTPATGGDTVTTQPTYGLKKWEDDPYFQQSLESAYGKYNANQSARGLLGSGAYQSGYEDLTSKMYNDRQDYYDTKEKELSDTAWQRTMDILGLTNAANPTSMTYDATGRVAGYEGSAAGGNQGSPYTPNFPGRPNKAMSTYYKILSDLMSKINTGNLMGNTGGSLLG